MNIPRLYSCVLLLSATAVGSLVAADFSPQPRLVSVQPVSPHVVALYVQEGEVERTQLLPYVPQSN